MLHPRRSSLGIVAAVAAFAGAPLLAQTGRSAGSAPPVADIVPKFDTLHGDVRVDNYFYIRDRTNPKVIPYLEAENAYTDARTKHTFRISLYDRGDLLRIDRLDLPDPYRSPN